MKCSFFEKKKEKRNLFLLILLIMFNFYSSRLCSQETERPSASSILKGVKEKGKEIAKEIFSDNPALSPVEIYLYLDQNFNVRKRIEAWGKDDTDLSEILNPETRREVYLVRMPDLREEELFFQSPSFVEAEDLVRVQGDGQKILIPVFIESEKQRRKIERSYDVVQRTVAHKVLGSDSWYIEERSGRGGFFLKILKNDRISFFLYKGREILDRFLQERAPSLIVNDYLRTRTQNYQDSFLSEFLRVAPIPNLTSNEFILRSARFIMDPPLKGDQGQKGILLPLHGFLGCEECLQEISRRSGLESLEEWNEKVLIPAVAKWTVKTQFEMGATFSAHTQNLLIQIDPQSGEILDFIARDLGDALLSPFLSLIQGIRKSEISLWHKKAKINYAYDSWVDRSKPYFSNVGYNLAGMTVQSVLAHEKKGKPRRRALGFFIESYHKALEVYLGQTFSLPSRSQEIIEELKKSDVPLKKTELSLQEPFNQMKNHERNLAAEVFDDLFQRASSLLWKNHQERFFESTSSQKKLLKVFTRELDRHRVSFTHPLARNHLKLGLSSHFLTDGEQIFAINDLTKELLGVTFDLDQEKKKKLLRPHKKMNVRVKGKVKNCISFLKKLI